MDSFVSSSFDKHPTDLPCSRRASRHGDETETGCAGHRPHQSLSGGDLLRHFMRQDFFTYQPTFAAFRRQPRTELRVVDQAMRRRFCVVPFDVAGRWRTSSCRTPRREAANFAVGDRRLQGLAKERPRFAEG